MDANMGGGFDREWDKFIITAPQILEMEYKDKAFVRTAFDAGFTAGTDWCLRILESHMTTDKKGA